MGRRTQPVDIWPAWLHFSCLGCSAVAAACLVAAAVGGVVWVVRGAEDPAASTPLTRRLAPVEELENGAVAVVRMRGYFFRYASYAAGEQIVASGWKEFGLGDVFAEALKAAASQEDVEKVALEFQAGRIMLIDPAGGRVRQIEFRRREDEYADFHGWVCDAGGRWLACVEQVIPRGAPEAEPQRFIRFVDLQAAAVAGGWKVPGGRTCVPLAWLDDAGAVVCVLRRAGPGDMAEASSSRSPARLVILRRDGKLLPLAELPGATYRIGMSGRWINVLLITSGNPFRAEQMVVDAHTGTYEKQQTNILPGTHPGRLGKDEILMAVNGQVAAWSPSAARLRWITWPSDEAAVSRAVICGPSARWAAVTVHRDRRAAAAMVDLSTGKFHALALPKLRDERISVLAAHHRKMRVLIAFTRIAVVPNSEATSYLAEAYLDLSRLNSDAGVVRPEQLLPAAESNSEE